MNNTYIGRTGCIKLRHIYTWHFTRRVKLVLRISIFFFVFVTSTTAQLRMVYKWLGSSSNYLAIRQSRVDGTRGLTVSVTNVSRTLTRTKVCIMQEAKCLDVHRNKVKIYLHLRETKTW